ncbi:hypothetical protein H2200_004898 [Cladophialophora chaetospira]|uniref:BHLH domain-containing protein n=1 Tax=Cladophialophora chaetospira TaxID=386627 RepID=A0AA38XEN0_9EURO|nr:hypothetical protein H2200_004898 [Cladophialophora chaetospira]
MATKSSITKENGKKKGRARPLPPDVNARNLRIEKQRREVMNEKFMDLARLVPGLVAGGRLSKSHIVEESARYLRQQRAIWAAAAVDMRELIDENRRLISELNVVRSQAEGSQGPLLQTRPIKDASLQLMNYYIDADWAPSTGFSEPTLHNLNGFQTSESEILLDPGFDVGGALDSSLTAIEETYCRPIPTPQSAAYFSNPGSGMVSTSGSTQLSLDFFSSPEYQDEHLFPVFSAQCLPVEAYSNPPTELPTTIPLNDITIHA